MSLRRYPKYKDSGVGWLGEVPAHWEVTAARRVFRQTRVPAHPDDEQLSATQKYGVIPQSTFMEREDQKVVLALKGTDSFKHVDANDFVISLRSFQGGIERCLYSGCVSPAYTVLKPSTEVDARFWAYLLKSDPYIATLQSVTDGIREGKTISYDQFGQIAVPLPVLPEQVTIAEFLDSETKMLEALRDEQQRLIELLKEKRQAVISHAVTKGLNRDAPMKDSGVEWIGDVPEHWQVLRLKNISSFTTSGPRGWSERISEAGSIFVQSGDLTEDLRICFAGCKRVQVDECAETSRTLLANGDVVVCITGAKTGNVAVCDGLSQPAYVNQHLCLIRPTANVLPHFLGLTLKSRVGQFHFELSQYGLKQGLGLENVRETPVLLPPLAEQEQILKSIDVDEARFNGLLEEANRSVGLLQERRTALISAAVTGKIDVRGMAKGQSA